ncbi:ABC transporter permease [Paenibacillus soyae]|uniref:ABC transporter permease n=1 Tax=Paenibacillus soyae TaxID=2969249 RepID=A0A9X2S8D6_9BACL|nr:ABC transporter permease [Paenibacillus soyae]MCR2804110.1 ABC transporter permease [Paenibacillus soyae]
MGIRSFMGLLASERLKLAKSPIWLLVPVSPVLAMLIGIFSNLADVAPGERYMILQAGVFTLHALLLLPLLTGILSSFVCRFEHSGGGWKSLLSLPVSRTGLYAAKFITVAVLLAAVQLLMLAALVVAVEYHGLDGGIDWGLAIPAVASGWAACLPLAALQLWASIGWSSFAAPLAINVAFTLPNMLIVNSETFSPFYPWAQPSLAMLSSGTMDFGGFAIPLETVLLTIAGSFLVFLFGGLMHMRRKEI